MKKITFGLSVSADQILRYYSGNAKAVIVTADDGRTLQIPADRFRPFVTQNGISGRFEITLDAHNKLIDLRKL